MLKSNNIDLQKITEKSIHLKFKKGQEVFTEGQLCENFLIVKSGKIRVYKTSEKGQTLTLYTVDSDHLCTFTTSCILSGTHYPASAVVEEDVEGFAINRETFDHLILNNNEFRVNIFKSLSERFTGLVQSIDDIAFHSLSERLEWFVRKNVDDSGELEMTHNEIAGHFGMERESVSRALKSLEKQGVISLSRGKVSLS